jgi:hypothetical protein
MSVLYLDGVKLSDTQMTVQALFLVTCILMISKATPLEELSRERPYSHVLHPYAIVTILAQVFQCRSVVQRLHALYHITLFRLLPPGSDSIRHRDQF